MQHAAPKIHMSAAMRICITIIFLFFTFPKYLEAANIVLGGGGGEYSIKTKTLFDQRFYKTIHQKYDFSCGSAALATLLKHHYGINVDEKTVIQRMYDVGDRKKIEREGFSMLDMKTYLASIGLKADGYKESLDKLVKVGVPAIVLINNNGYLHFVVVKGVTEDKVLLGDPSLGARTVDRKLFQSQWNNILFVINDRMDIGRKTFNTAEAWSIRPKSRFNHQRMISNFDLARLTIDYSITPNYY
jgi:predicted double-glycine peptidase